jgi:DNA-binding PadR family transcriptional regulator
MTNAAPSHTQVSEQVFYILLSLSSGSKHGYAILKEIEAISDGALRLSTSTLYGALSRLEDQGFIRRVAAKDDATPGLPRKVYELTQKGLKLLNLETERIHRMSRIAQDHLPESAA